MTGFGKTFSFSAPLEIKSRVVLLNLPFVGMLAPLLLPVSRTHPGPSAESGRVLSHMEQGGQVAGGLEGVSPLPPASPALVRPERRHNLRHRTGGGVSVDPGLVQRGNACWKRAEGACMLRSGLRPAPVGVRRLEGCSVALRPMLLRGRRAPPLVPLFEREVVPVWGLRWAGPGQHGPACVCARSLGVHDFHFRTTGGAGITGNQEVSPRSEQQNTQIRAHI